MDDFDEYNMLRKFEFHEFLGRLSYLLYDEQRPLHKKIEDLLAILLGDYTSQQLKIPNPADDIESDSDYEDDVVDNIMSGLIEQYWEDLELADVADGIFDSEHHNTENCS